MATITAATLTALLKDTVTTATAEACLQQAIDEINLAGTGYEVEIADLTGADGLKTGDYTGAEKAGIIRVATAVYSQNYKNSGASSSNSESVGVGGLNYSTSSSSSLSSSGSGSSVVSAVAQDVVRMLQRNNIEVSVG
jgi:hypothetical protein